MFRPAFRALLEEVFAILDGRRRRSKWRTVEFWFGLGGLVAAASSAVFTCWTVWEMRYEQRAWIGAPTITPHRSRNEGWVTFDYAITNIGKSMPSGLYIGAGLVGPGTNQPNLNAWREVSRAKCAEGREEAARHADNFSRFSVVPGGAFLINEENAGKAINTKVDVRRPDALQHQIAGCIVYRINGVAPWDDTLRQTEFVAPLVPGEKDLPATIPYTIQPQ